MSRAWILPAGMLVAAVAALGVSMAWAAGRTDHHPWGGMMGRGSTMMGSRTPMVDVGVAPVSGLAGARRRADAFAGRMGLRSGEVMRFDNHYYAELIDAGGNGATEVLVDPRTGTVMVEPGPAMMWNTRFGMMGGATGGMARMMGSAADTGGMMGTTMMGPEGMRTGRWRPGTAPGTGRSSTATRLTAAGATAVATRWLAAESPGVAPGEPEGFPGYFTFDATRDGRTVGMLSVNATTGAVWPHTWHGRFVASDG